MQFYSTNRGRKTEQHTLVSARRHPSWGGLPVGVEVEGMVNGAREDVTLDQELTIGLLVPI